MDEGYIGEIKLFAGNFFPNGWFPCDGRFLVVQDYPQLFSLIDYKYGGSGTTFKLPDLRGNFPMQCCNIPLPSPARKHDLGEYGGNRFLVFDWAQLPKHTHALSNVEGVITGEITQSLDVLRYSSQTGNTAAPVGNINVIGSMISNVDGAGEIPLFNSVTPSLAIGGVAVEGDNGNLAFSTDGLTVSNAYAGKSQADITFSIVPFFLAMTFFINYNGTYPAQDEK